MGEKDPGRWTGPRGRLLSLGLARPSAERGYVIAATRACWRLARSVRHVDRGGRHACALELLPVDRTMFAHYASMTLTTIRLHPTRLETRTKESNMCASLRVIETRGRNESKGCPRRLR